MLSDAVLISILCNMDLAAATRQNRCSKMIPEISVLAIDVVLVIDGSPVDNLALEPSGPLDDGMLLLGDGADECRTGGGRSSSDRCQRRSLYLPWEKAKRRAAHLWTACTKESVHASCLLSSLSVLRSHLDLLLLFLLAYLSLLSVRLRVPVYPVAHFLFC
jgi:hypothetical protein